MADADLQVKFGADVSALQASLSAVRSALDNLSTGLGSLQSTFSGLSTSITQQAAAMAQLAVSMQSAASQAKGSESAFSGFGKSLTGLDQAAEGAKKIQDIADSVGGLAKAFKALPSVETEATAGMAKFDIAADANEIGAVVLAIVTVGTAAIELVQWLEQLYQTNEMVRAGFDAVGGIFSGLAEILAGVSMAVMTLAEGVAHLGEGFGQLIGIALQPYLDQLKESWDFLKAAVDLVSTAVGIVIGAVSDFVERRFGVEISAVTTAWNGVKAAIDGVVSAIEAGLKSAFDWLGGKLDDLIQLIGRFIGLKFPDVVGSWSTTLNEVSAGFRAAANAAEQLWSVLTGHAPSSSTGPSGAAANGSSVSSHDKSREKPADPTSDQKNPSTGGSHGGSRGGASATPNTGACAQDAEDCAAKTLDAQIAGDQQKLAADQASHADMRANLDQYLGDVKARYGEDSDQYRQAAEQRAQYDSQLTPIIQDNAEARTDIEKKAIGDAVQAWLAGYARIAQGAKTTTQTVKISWADVVDPLVHSFTSGLVQMAEGTKSFAQVMSGLGQQILDDFIKNVVDKKVEAWILSEIGQTTASQAQSSIRKAVQLVEAILGVTTSKSTAAATIAANAAQAYAGAWAATAAIPFIGPELAPAAAATAYAGAISAEGLMAAAGGFDVPAGLNPITQLHASEMVLPAHLANPLRTMLSGYSAANFNSPAAANDAGDTHLHLHVQAMDAQSFKGFLRNNSDHLSTVLQEMGRRGMKTG